ncbi:hypothetical protein AwDysgo_02900 [Bacteroidales bacterium]|nr:hypothetical protein AwDysgo_02900 [Bacteroidales bacterium]
MSDVNLADIGRTNPITFAFNTMAEVGNIQRCTIRTSNIYINDSIGSIKVSLKGKYLTIKVVSSPYDWGCGDCRTMHILDFQLPSLDAGEYTVNTDINNNDRHSFKHTFF